MRDDGDAEFMRSLGIDPTTVASNRHPRSPRPRPAATPGDDPRGLAKLQDILRDYRPSSPVKRTDGVWHVPIYSTATADCPDLKFGVKLDVDRTPRAGDVLLLSTTRTPKRKREFLFALVERVVSTGGVNVRLSSRWDGGPRFDVAFRVTRRELIARAYNIDGVVTNPEALKAPITAGSRLEELISLQRAAVVPRLSGRQGARDDRIGEEFIVVLDCEATPRVGDVVVTRWRYAEGLEEHVDVVADVLQDGTLSLEAYYGGDASLISTVTPGHLIQRRVFFEGIIRSSERGKLPSAG